MKTFGIGSAQINLVADRAVSLSDGVNFLSTCLSDERSRIILERAKTISMPNINSSKYLPYAEAKKFVRGLRLQTSIDYQNWSAGNMADKPARPANIPANPHKIYGSDWKGFGDWLGTKRIANFKRTFLPFAEAREFVIKLGLRTRLEWDVYRSGYMPKLGPRPANIPTAPDQVYKETGWAGIRYWLGVGEPEVPKKSRYMPFVQAQEFVRSLGLSGQLEWRAYVRGKRPNLPLRPKNIPSMLHIAYKGEGWVSYGEFLGTGNVANHDKPMRCFADAREFARSLGLGTLREWRAWSATKARPNDIPANPDRYYGKQWRGSVDWLSLSPIKPAPKKVKPKVKIPGQPSTLERYRMKREAAAVTKLKKQN